MIAYPIVSHYSPRPQGDRQRRLRLEHHIHGAYLKIYDWDSEGIEGVDVEVFSTWIFWWKRRCRIIRETSRKVYCG